MRGQTICLLAYCEEGSATLPFTISPHVRSLLGSSPVFNEANRTRLEEALARSYKVRSVEFGASDVQCLGVANRAQLAGVTLHYCRYDAPLQIGFANTDGFRQYFCLSGSGQININGRHIELSCSSTGILPPGSDFIADYGDHYSQLVLQLSEPILLRQMELMLGKEVARPIRLPTLHSLDAAKLYRLKAVAMALAIQFSDGPDPNRVFIAELEQALTTAFLVENKANFPTFLTAQPKLAGRRDVRRLEDYIHAHWDRPLTIEDVAQACGLSVRSVHARFKDELGVTPATYLRRVRLEQAHQRLLESDGDVTVVEVAFKCGFSSLGHFAQRYRERFGELPSETLAQRHRRLAPTKPKS